MRCSRSIIGRKDDLVENTQIVDFGNMACTLHINFTFIQRSKHVLATSRLILYIPETQIDTRDARVQGESRWTLVDKKRSSVVDWIRWESGFWILYHLSRLDFYSQFRCNDVIYYVTHILLPLARMVGVVNRNRCSRSMSRDIRQR